MNPSKPVRLLTSERPKAVSTIPPVCVTHRDLRQEAAILFIHGFSGDPRMTWGTFPDFVASDKRIAGWDIFSLGYATSLAPDLVGAWSADAPLISLADLLRTTVALPPLDGHKSLALVAHSMGGLIVQRALLDDRGFTSRVGHVVLFGTPSLGLVKASPLRFWKRQIRDMARGGPFITDLRERWDRRFGNQLRFVFWAVAGDRDEFVPRASSIDSFPPEQRAVIPGDHLEIVKPLSAQDLSVQLVLKALVGDAAPAGPWNSARVAVESREFHRAVQLLEPHKAELDDQALVQFALALEGVGRQQDAIRILEEQGRSSTDAMGVLAGRLKRRWLAERRRDDADRTMELYRGAFTLAEKGNDSAQAFYHGINIAFMELAYRGHREGAKRMAKKVLGHCAKAPREKWRLATEGEALLYLGETDTALERYREAVETRPQARELDSMYRQAVWVGHLVEDKSVLARLEAIFRGGN